MKGFLFIHRGGPDSAEFDDVASYVKKFYSDMRVSINGGVLGWLDKKKHLRNEKLESLTQSYKDVWDEHEGDPLVTQMEHLVQQLDLLLPEIYMDYAFCFGQRSVEKAVTQMIARGVTELRVIPLFPQSSLLGTQISLDRVRDALSKNKYTHKASFLSNFYREPGFIEHYSSHIERHLKSSAAEHMLFCFSGVSEKHLEVIRPEKSVCGMREDCCDSFNDLNRFCYRAQCFDTARRVADELGFDHKDYSVIFYPVVGLENSIEPQSDSYIKSLSSLGLKRVSAVSMSSVVDSVESLFTLKESLENDFLESGGEDFSFIPCLNIDPYWVSSFAQLLTDNKRWIEIDVPQMSSKKQAKAQKQKKEESTDADQ